MTNLFKKLWLLLVLGLSAQHVAAGSLAQAKNVAAQAKSSFFDKFYKAESVRTAIVRSGMAVSCLTDGSCCSGDLVILGLAAASIITATCYQACAQQRYTWLPAKFNLIADGLATLASFDAGWLPITGTTLETQLRTGIGYLSSIITGLLFLT